MSFRSSSTLAAALVLALWASPAGAQFNPVGGLGSTDGRNMVEETTYTVKPGDTLYGIALQFYGDGFRWPDIFNANRAQVENPDLIFPGQVFKIPKGEKTEIKVKATYTTKEGDTLAALSQQFYGTPDRWKEIYAANADKIKDPSDLEAGLELKIPESSGPAAPDASPGGNEPRPPVGSNPGLEQVARQGGVTTRSPEFARWASEALDIANGWDFPNVRNKYGETVSRADYLRAILYIESGGIHKKVGGAITKSYAGALGFMQLMPGTARGLGVDPYDGRQNLLGGARYIGETLRGPNTKNAADGPIEKLCKAACGYNRGPYASELRTKTWDEYVRTCTVNENVQYGILLKMCLGLDLSGSERSWIMRHRGVSAGGVDDMAQRYYKGSHSLF